MDDCQDYFYNSKSEELDREITCVEKLIRQEQLEYNLAEVMPIRIILESSSMCLA